jgi:hypothetical protein
VSERDPIPWPDDVALASQPELDEAEERALGEALRAAWAPAALEPARNRELIERALVDPLAPPTDEEIRESERLRQALETNDESHEDVRLLRALSAADAPARLSTDGSERARGALAHASRAPKTNVFFVSFGAAALAAAAAFALFAGKFELSSPPRAERLAPSRSTADLFDREFEPGGTTERIDRIASARAHDLRNNRYARWGAR